MKLILFSPEAGDPREHAVVEACFAAGLRTYHLRKPGWPRARISAWLQRLAPEFHSRVVLHSHHDLKDEFAVGGTHDRDDPKKATPPQLVKSPDFSRPLLRSRAVHDLETLRRSLPDYDRVLFSPLFPSISKPDYRPSPQTTGDSLRTLLLLPRRAEVIALGGVDVSRVSICRELGFDGVAVLGAIWQSVDPVNAFTALQSAPSMHAG